MKRSIISLVVIACLFLFQNCDKLTGKDKGWGEESALNGTWTGGMRSGSGTYASMEVTLKDGEVYGGKLNYTYLKVSNIVGNYKFDGTNFEMDFDNEASDFRGTGDAASLSGDRIVSDELDGTFSISKE